MTLSEFEIATASDRYADYCLWDYRPIASPIGKLRCANLLWCAIDAGAGGPMLKALCLALREALGPFRTVFGVKQCAGRLSLELYFYDYARLEREVSITRVLKILSPFVACPLAYSERRPYFMFSLDLDEAVASGQRPLDLINIYIGNPGSSVSSGICYELSPTALRLANFYFFFTARKEMDQIAAKIGCSAHHDLPDLPLSAILRPELLDCEVVVVANKKFHDGVYFSRVKIDALTDFLHREGFPSNLVAFAREHRDRLDHMLYDIGIDYAVEDGGVRVLKTAFYGLL